MGKRGFTSQFRWCTFPLARRAVTSRRMCGHQHWLRLTPDALSKPNSWRFRSDVVDRRTLGRIRSDFTISAINSWLCQRGARDTVLVWLWILHLRGRGAPTRSWTAVPLWITWASAATRPLPASLSGRTLLAKTCLQPLNSFVSPENSQHRDYMHRSSQRLCSHCWRTERRCRPQLAKP
jgi:hypothetical protein